VVRRNPGEHGCSLSGPRELCCRVSTNLWKSLFLPFAEHALRGILGLRLRDRRVVIATNLAAQRKIKSVAFQTIAPALAFRRYTKGESFPRFGRSNNSPDEMCRFRIRCMLGTRWPFADHTKGNEGFESHSLRHSVWDAEKLGCISRKIARDAAILRFSPRNRTGESALLNQAGQQYGHFLWRADTQSGFNEPTLRTECDWYNFARWTVVSETGSRH
jgi:hypothetical protein